MSDSNEVLIVTPDTTGNVSYEVRVNVSGEGAGAVMAELYQPGGASVGAVSLPDLLVAARNFQPITIMAGAAASVNLGRVAVLQCACFAQEKQVQALRDLFARMQSPNVIMEMNGGVINDVKSDQPVNLIVLDEDIEGADADGIVTVNGHEWYQSQFSIGANDVALDKAHVSAVLFELLNQPQAPAGEAP